MSEQPADGSTGEIPFGLLWGIKRSFIAYVRRMPDGQGSIHDGAVPLGDDTLLFPADDATASAAAAPDVDHVWAFRGDIRFKGHGGMLFVRVAAPLITVRGEEADLSIEDPYARADAARVPLVTLRLQPGPAPEGAQVWLGSDVRLTEAGSVLFNDVYQPGEPFEQLSVVLPLRG
ncbi:HtaA domain-containing protein [Trujillonella endophytica]|uniref:Htaa protein n=1 Tax=Trujillonella endophytica TaxID=673521 RepID=A0A1H8T344_9ACTN|nr:HtaA domain-containing protein [Trujillella endophytica]SEO85235.1 Htaa protein [Trujillella endophytica]